MTNISSQDFRNVYERFYKYVRRYLWPYEVLVDLANVEVDIYSGFVDFDQLRSHLNKLETSIREVLKDDVKLSKAFNELKELLDVEEPNAYLRLPGVEEVNPENDKAIRTLPDRIEEDEE